MAKAIPRLYLTNYDKVITALSEEAQAKALKAIGSVRLDDVAAAREAIIAIMQPICSAYTDAAAATAAKFYEICRAYVIGGEYEAFAESGREPGATEGAVRALMQIVVDGKPSDQLYTALAERIDYEIKRAANDCVIRNGDADPWKG